MNRPEVHDVFRRWRAIADAYEHEPILVGETWVADVIDARCGSTATAPTSSIWR